MAPARERTRMSVEVGLALSGPVRLAHSIIDAAAGDPAVCVVQLNMLGPASLAEVMPGCSPWGAPEIPAAEVMVELEAPDDMAVCLSLGEAGLAALIDYLTHVQAEWRTGTYR